jgi:hypothetical protein
MNKKSILSLLSTPMLVSSILSMGTMASQAQAAELDTDSTDKLTCVSNDHIIRPVCVRASVLDQLPEYNAEADYLGEGENDFLGFSVEESDMAVLLFNCDCEQCINTLRGMRGLAPIT